MRRRRHGSRDWRGVHAPSSFMASTRWSGNTKRYTSVCSPGRGGRAGDPQPRRRRGSRRGAIETCAESPASSIRRGAARSIATCSSRMNESQHHRGPDEDGVHVEPGVGLGHRRLSIIDLSTGQQPLYNEDRSVCRRLQRRDLQLPGADPRADRARPRVPHAQRHRSHRPRVGGVGRGVRRRASAACSRSRCGIATARRCFSRATGSASSRCTTRCCPTAC